jgi:ABC-type sugar transport system ATPase subunit
MAEIHVEQLRKTFGRQVAVEGLDLRVGDGELLVFLGPSGCGKTTTLNCIAGLESPTSGRILFDGEDVTALPPHARNIAMVFQSSLLYPHLSARQNIEASLRHSGLAAAGKAERIRAAAEVLDITTLLDKLPSQLSGGERQRVATAKAIVRQPTAFLLDEPLAALDAALRLTLRAELVNLQKRLATTMVFVTHDQTEAMTMGDRIAVMQAGRLEQIGSPDQIYNDPASQFVAGFVGAPPMNFFTGEVRVGDGAVAFTATDLRVDLAGLPAAALAGAASEAGAVLGVRPQHLAVLDEARAGALPATVFAVEHLGKESVVILEDAARTRIRALVEPDFAARVGDRLQVAPDPAKCFLFDRAGGRIA